MLFLHEIHRVVGEREDEFEATFRDGWKNLLAEGEDARLLWYFKQVMGSGASYNVLTITAVRDGASWERLAKDIQAGSLRDWAAEADRHRYEVVGKLMLLSSWSPMQDLDLASVPVDDDHHPVSLFMHDTGWAFAHANLDDYIQFQNTHYYHPLRNMPEASNIDFQAFFQNAHGAGKRKECVFIQKMRQPEGLIDLFMHDLPPEHRAPGTYMGEGLKYRDQWESRLVRTSTWSPFY